MPDDKTNQPNSGAGAGGSTRAKQENKNSTNPGGSGNGRGNCSGRGECVKSTRAYADIRFRDGTRSANHVVSSIRAGEERPTGQFSADTSTTGDEPGSSKTIKNRNQSQPNSHKPNSQNETAVQDRPLSFMRLHINSTFNNRSTTSSSSSGHELLINTAPAGTNRQIATGPNTMEPEPEMERVTGGTENQFQISYRQNQRTTEKKVTASKSKSKQ